MNSQQTHRTRFSYRMLLTLILVISAAVLFWHVIESAQSIQEKIRQAKPWLALWRISLFVLIIAYWPQLTEKLAKYFHWSMTDQNDLKAQRWRIAGWLIVIELVLVQGVVHKFAGALLP